MSFDDKEAVMAGPCVGGKDVPASCDQKFESGGGDFERKKSLTHSSDRISEEKSSESDSSYSSSEEDESLKRKRSKRGR